MKETVIGKEAEGQRIDKFVRKILNDAPLSFIYKLFRKKDVKVNGHWADINYIIKCDDVIRIYVKDEQLEEFNKPKLIIKQDFNHEIIYEDQNILVINKPRGLLVHGDEKERRTTLSNQVLSYLYSKGEYDPETSLGFTPGPAHRIDRNTSGIVVFGKNLPSLQSLFELFKNHEAISKTYLALVVGEVNKSGTVNLPLLKDEKNGKVVVSQKGQPAVSEYEVKENYNGFTLLKVHILTGRTHQIRVHMKEIDHPLVGDAKYGDFAVNKEFKNLYGYENQFLHAYQVKFVSPKGVLSYLKGKEFTCPLGVKEKEILEKIRRR